MKKLKVGDTVWIERFGYRYNPKIREIEPATITKVGKKYFEVDKCLRTKFQIKDAKQVTDHAISYKIWFSIEEWKKKKEDTEVTEYVKNYMRDNFNKICIENLYKIKEIICTPSERSKILSDGGKNGGITS